MNEVFLGAIDCNALTLLCTKWGDTVGMKQHLILLRPNGNSPRIETLSLQIRWPDARQYSQPGWHVVGPPRPAPASTAVHSSLLHLLLNWIMWVQCQTLQKEAKAAKCRVSQSTQRPCPSLFFPVTLSDCDTICDSSLSPCYYRQRRSKKTPWFLQMCRWNLP